MIISGAVEGDVDEALLRRIVTYTGLCLGTVYGRKGKQFLLQSIDGYNKAAQFSPWVVLIDLNGDCECAPECLHQWLANPAQHMCFRIAVRAIEAWVLADRERMAQWLRVSEAKISREPDSLANPKQELINLARRSRRRQLQKDIVPRQGGGRAVGPLYTARIIQFIQDQTDGWRPDSACLHSDSLKRCIDSLKQLAEEF